eukprot:GHVU01196615.1.p1 GENE.GHVU01196615.1~~GHVU01196615.1.p1  ORF type:complete len:392 (+),score=79.75 GHVU01196615.1:598-1773(+)
MRGELREAMRPLVSLGRALVAAIFAAAQRGSSLVGQPPPPPPPRSPAVQMPSAAAVGVGAAVSTEAAANEEVMAAREEEGEREGEYESAELRLSDSSSSRRRYHGGPPPRDDAPITRFRLRFRQLGFRYPGDAVDLVSGLLRFGGAAAATATRGPGRPPSEPTASSGARPTPAELLRLVTRVVDAHFWTLTSLDLRLAESVVQRLQLTGIPSADPANSEWELLEARIKREFALMPQQVNRWKELVDRMRNSTVVLFKDAPAVHVSKVVWLQGAAPLINDDDNFYGNRPTPQTRRMHPRGAGSQVGGGPLPAADLTEDGSGSGHGFLKGLDLADVVPPAQRPPGLRRSPPRDRWDPVDLLLHFNRRQQLRGGRQQPDANSGSSSASRRRRQG